MAKDKQTQQSEPECVALVERLVSENRPQVLQAQGRVGRALSLAHGLEQMREAVRPLMPRVMGLQGSPLGFLTDKDRQGGYGEDVVRECVVEALLRGVNPTANEFNIIAGRCYITKAGYQRLVRELEGLTDLALSPGVPKTMPGGAIVPFEATWRWQGRAQEMRTEIPVRLNAGMGVDGAVGKATRKALARIYERCTGSCVGEDADDDMLPQLPARLSPPAPRTRVAMTREVQQLTRELAYSPGDLDGVCAEFGVDALDDLSDADLAEWLDKLRAEAEVARRELAEEGEEILEQAEEEQRGELFPEASGLPD